MVKVGTLVKFKSADELVKIRASKYGHFSDEPVVKSYANKVALVVAADRGDYGVYFPETDTTSWWSKEEEFVVVNDLLEYVRGK